MQQNFEEILEQLTKIEKQTGAYCRLLLCSSASRMEFYISNGARFVDGEGMLLFGNDHPFFRTDNIGLMLQMLRRASKAKLSVESRLELLKEKRSELRDDLEDVEKEIEELTTPEEAASE